MKPQALLLLLLVAALATVAFFALRDGGDVIPANLPGADAAGDAVATDGKPAVESGAVDSDASESRDAVGTTAEMTRTAAPDAAPTEASAKGCLLRGRLVDRQGAALAATEVSVATFPQFGGRVELVGGGGERSAVSETVTTDSEGWFEARVKTGIAGSLDLVASDLVFVEHQRFEAKGPQHEFGDLVVVRAARLAGIVQDQNGKPVAGVHIEAQLGAMGLGVQSTADSGDDGTFTIGKLRPGEWMLRTESGDFLPFAEPFELEAEQQRTDLVLVLKPGYSISGRVVDDRGVGVAGMKVGSRRNETIGNIDIQRFSGDEVTVTDEHGNFTLAGLAGEKATLRAYGPGHTSVTTANVKTNTANHEMRVWRLGSIAGVLVTPDGTPIVGSRVTAETQAANSGAVRIAREMGDVEWSLSGASAKTNERGEFVLDSVKPGMVIIKARGKTHLPIEQDGVRVTPDQDVEGLRLVANAGATARVRVVDDAGAAIVGVHVSLARLPKKETSGMHFARHMRTDEDGEMVMFGSTKIGSADTDENGIATIMGLPGGDVVVSASHDDYAPSTKGQLALPATGSVDGRVVMLAPSYIDVLVTRADGGASVGTHVVLQRGATSDGESVDQKTSDDEGRVRFGPLASGDYVALLSLGSKERGVGGMMVFVGNEQATLRSSAKSVAVRAGETVAVELKFPVLTRFTGRVVGVDGPVAGCVVNLAEADDESSVPGFGGREEKAGTDGMFVFDNLESGSYLVTYGKAAQVVKATLELEVLPNTPELHRELHLRTGTVRVLVLSKDDAEPVEKAEVTLRRADENGKSGRRPRRIMMVSMTMTGDGAQETSTMTFGQERVMTDEDGVAVFEDVPIGNYTLKVESRKFAPVEKPGVAVVERQLTDCGTLEVEAAGQVRGTVTDGNGERVMALVERRLLGTQEWAKGEMAMQGSYRLRGLAPGQYELRARALGPTSAGPSEPVVVQVFAGKTKVADLKVTN